MHPMLVGAKYPGRLTLEVGPSTLVQMKMVLMYGFPKPGRIRLLTIMSVILMQTITVTILIILIQGGNLSRLCLIITLTLTVMSEVMEILANSGNCPICIIN